MVLMMFIFKLDLTFLPSFSFSLPLATLSQNTHYYKVALIRGAESGKIVKSSVYFSAPLLTPLINTSVVFNL